jgi:hypothetical protein
MKIVEGAIAIVGLAVVVFIMWLVEQYKKDEWKDLDFYDGEES